MASPTLGEAMRCFESDATAIRRQLTEAQQFFKKRADAVMRRNESR